MAQLKTQSAVDLANLSSKTFKKVSVKIVPKLFEDIVDEDEFHIQYREFFQWMKDVSDTKVVQDGDSMVILTFIFNHSSFYRDIEAIMGVLGRAAVTIGVESVVESWVSQNEYHNSQRRPLGESLNITETAVFINGPNPVNCDDLVEETMKYMWKNCKISNSSEGHYIRRSSDIRSYTVSKAVDKVTSIPVKLPFMSK